MSSLSHLLAEHPMYWVATYGYWAVFFFVAIESSGIPAPGEAALVSVAAFAGATHQLDIYWIVAAAAGGAVVGDNLGYLAGRKLGFPLLLRHGGAIGLNEGRLKLGQYLFDRYGGAIVFFGRFIAVLRAAAALLAGVNCMPWRRFLVFNAAGGISWALIFGFGGYVFGNTMLHKSGKISLVFLIVATIAVVVGFIAIARQEKRLIAKAELALPGPLRQNAINTPL
jgi:membrane protein DedA with SNARE-associated domain